MFLLLELDNDFTFGIDWMPPHIFGIRIGWIAVHIVFAKFRDTFRIIEDQKAA